MSRVVAIIVTGLLLLGAAQSSSADEPGPGTTSGDVDSGVTKFFAIVDQTESVVTPGYGSSGQTVVQSGPVLDWFSEDVCSGGGERGCAGYVRCEDGSVMQSVYGVAPDGTQTDADLVCLGEAGEPVPQVTDAVAAQAFARIPVPGSELVIQPPGGRTLVNFETNFYTTNTQTFLRSVRLLGQRIQLRIRPVGYTWVFGDGGSRSTTDPGAAYPDLRVTHRYLLEGGVSPRVDTAYAATWRLGAGSWRPVPGTVTATGGTEVLDVRTARPKLVF